MNNYSVIVIGGGHAGAEAAWAAANMLGDSGGQVALVTMDPAKIGVMSCNPAIGGLAKGQIVREIDALGGLMGLAADATGIQFRVLNSSKGPAVRGPRCQSDKYQYAAEVQRLLKTRKNLDILSGRVEDFLIENGQCKGIQYTPVRIPEPDNAPSTSASCCGDFSACKNDKPISQLAASDNRVLYSESVVLTTGTFMRGLMHTGQTKTKGGRVGEASANSISKALQKMGFELARLKTGTPPRLNINTVDLSGLQIQPGDSAPLPFSEMTDGAAFPALKQSPCWITHTNSAIHDLIRANLDRAPMYNGQISTTGPRYCPSIETKIVRFADRDSHHIFLEPESLDTNELYCNGISTSLPGPVQEKMVHMVPGCEKAEILRFGYAVEYDMVPARQIDTTCMTKLAAGLFFAGQINGTTGYEEAAGQGLIAGINAAQRALGKDEFRLRRDQAYIGVLMDDLVTKIPREPYRMFTSRAEHRLRLRADNADERLTSLGRNLGMVDDQRWQVFTGKQRNKKILTHFLDTHKIEDKPIEKWIASNQPTTRQLVEKITDTDLPAAALDIKLVATVLADKQYAGYIQRQQKQIERLTAEEDTALPIMDFSLIPGLRDEAALTLNKFKPATLGQARRLAGVNPADIMLLSIARAKKQTPQAHTYPAHK